MLSLESALYHMIESLYSICVAPGCRSFCLIITLNVLAEWACVWLGTMTNENKITIIVAYTRLIAQPKQHA